LQPQSFHAVGDTLDGLDFNELAERAERQRSRLEGLRRRAASEAFTTAS